MITPLQKHPSLVEPKSSVTISQKPVTTSSGKTPFQELFSPLRSASTPTVTKPGASTAGTPAAPAASTATPQASQPIPIPPITDLHDQGQVEAHMNAWLENVTQNSNDQKMQIYQQAMTDWKANSVQYQALGMPVPPPPAPPNLDAVQPMPTGWWFQS